MNKGIITRSLISFMDKGYSIVSCDNEGHIALHKPYFEYDEETNTVSSQDEFYLPTLSKLYDFCSKRLTEKENTESLAKLFVEAYKEEDMREELAKFYELELDVLDKFVSVIEKGTSKIMLFKTSSKYFKIEDELPVGYSYIDFVVDFEYRSLFFPKYNDYTNDECVLEFEDYGTEWAFELDDFTDDIKKNFTDDMWTLIRIAKEKHS